MKKFKTSAEKRQLQEAALGHLLAEKSLVRSSLLNYSHIPLGLAIGAVCVLVAWLAGLPLRSLDMVLQGWLGLGFIAFFYMLQAWEAFSRHRRQLSNVRNAFAGSMWPPLVIGALLLYMASPLGTLSFGLSAGLILMALGIHLPLNGVPLKRKGQLIAPLFVIYATLVLALPLSHAQAVISPAALGTLGVGALALIALSAGWLGPKAKASLLLDAGPSEKIPSPKDAAHQNLVK